MNNNTTTPPLKNVIYGCSETKKVGGSNNSHIGHEKLGDVRLLNAPFSNAVSAAVYFVII